jgi:hypothetical protein
MNRLVYLFLTFLVVQVVFCPVYQEILEKFLNEPPKQLFKAYLKIFNKNYDLNTEEGIRRYKIFKENIKFINEENSKNLSYKLGINKFADLTNEEYKQSIKGDMSEYETLFPKLERKIIKETEYKVGEVIVDHRQHFGPVKDQGKARSSWTFGTIGAIEGNYSKKFGVKLRLSEQHLYDCMKTGDVYQFFLRHGIMRENDYPYTSDDIGDKGVCKTTIESPIYEIVTGKKYKFGASYSEWQNIVKDGPVIVSYDASSRIFQFYQSGIINITDCLSANHIVLVVGIQSDEQGDYLIVRNSWGAWWGENGYFRIRVNLATGTCNITNVYIQPILIYGKDPSTNPQPSPLQKPNPNCPILYEECNFGGIPISLCSGNSNLYTSGFYNVNRSFKLGPAKKVEFFNSANCIGNKGLDVSLTKEEKCFDYLIDPKKSYVNKANSIAVSIDNPPPGCIWVYRDSCYLGDRVEICNDVSDLTCFGFNRQISSFRLSEGVNVSFFTYPNYTARELKFYKDRAGFEYSEYANDAFMSVKIFKN